MNKSFRPVKLLPVWIAISSAIILAGILLFALLGFDFSAERPASKTVEVTYNVVVSGNPDSVAALEKSCDDIFKANGLSVQERATQESSNAVGTEKLVYTFSADASDKALADATDAVNTYANTAFTGAAEVDAVWHSVENQRFIVADWRGAIAVAVGAVVALIYIGVRFRVSSALAGLVVCVHDVLFTLSLLAILRIPLYAASPLLLAGVSAVCSLVLWMVHCAKLRSNAKDVAYSALDGAEVVEESLKTAWKPILIVAGALAATLLLIGAVAAAGTRLLVLPALIAVAVSVYSSLLLGPAVLAPIRKSFSRFTVKQKRYFGKKKAIREEQPKEE